MDANKAQYSNIDAYIATFPTDVRVKLEQLRHAIQQAAPLATEVISYNMPAFKGNKVLVYFAAYKNHIGFYPTAKPMVVFQEKLTEFKTSKGAVQFPLNQEMPLKLVAEMVKFRVAEDVLKKPTSGKRK